MQVSYTSLTVLSSKWWLFINPPSRMVQSTTLISGRKESQRLVALSLVAGLAAFIGKNLFWCEGLLFPNTAGVGQHKIARFCRTSISNRRFATRAFHITKDDCPPHNCLKSFGFGVPRLRGSEPPEGGTPN